MISKDRKQRAKKRNPRSEKIIHTWAFLIGVLTLYTILFSTSSARVMAALKTSGIILIQIAVPLSMAFIIMVGFNFFSGHDKISSFLDRRKGILGVAFSSLAGILSMGPIYAWYPVLRSLRKKGVSDFHLANFLSNRAIKPFLFPVMVFYFGWFFTLILNMLLLIDSLLTAKIVSILVKEDQ